MLDPDRADRIDEVRQRINRLEAQRRAAVASGDSGRDAQLQARIAELMDHKDRLFGRRAS